MLRRRIVGIAVNAGHVKAKPIAAAAAAEPGESAAVEVAVPSCPTARLFDAALRVSP